LPRIVKQFSSIEADTLAELITPIMLQHNRHSSLTSLSDPDIRREIVQAWIRGDTFSAILEMMQARDVRIGGRQRRPKVEDVVAICEGGLAYEGAMIVASLVDLSDDGDGLERAAFELLQRQFKAGLSPEAALSMHEIGFADREVAKRLAEAFPAASTYAAASADFSRYSWIAQGISRV
jgi:hypothetical protein